MYLARRVMAMTRRPSSFAFRPRGTGLRRSRRLSLKDKSLLPRRRAVRPRAMVSTSGNSGMVLWAYVPWKESGGRVWCPDGETRYKRDGFRLPPRRGGRAYAPGQGRVRPRGDALRPDERPDVGRRPPSVEIRADI